MLRNGIVLEDSMDTRPVEHELLANAARLSIRVLTSDGAEAPDASWQTLRCKIRRGGESSRAAPDDGYSGFEQEYLAVSVFRRDTDALLK
jgi:hypothetical protein